MILTQISPKFQIKVQSNGGTVPNKRFKQFAGSVWLLLLFFKFIFSRATVYNLVAIVGYRLNNGSYTANCLNPNVGSKAF